MMTTETMIKTLIETKNYDREQTERLDKKIDALSPDIRAALEHWMETDDTESPEYFGYTVNKILLMQDGMTVLGAFLALDWIRRDPKIAIKALSYHTIERF